MDDVGIHFFFDKGGDGINIFLRPGAKAKVMQATGILVEAHTFLSFRRLSNQNAGSAAYTVKCRVILDQGFHFQEMTQLLPKGQAAINIVDGHLDMRNTI
jgi:hypothetical protein